MMKQKYRSEYKKFKEEKQQKLKENMMILDNVIKGAKSIN